MDAGIRDHRAAIGGADEQDRLADLVELGPHPIRVVGETRGPIRHRRQVDRDRPDVGRFEVVHHRVPAPRAVPGTVDEHNGPRHDREA